MFFKPSVFNYFNALFPKFLYVFEIYISNCNLSLIAKLNLFSTAVSLLREITEFLMYYYSFFLLPFTSRIA